MHTFRDQLTAEIARNLQEEREHFLEEGTAAEWQQHLRLEARELLREGGASLAEVTQGLKDALAAEENPTERLHQVVVVGRALRQLGQMDQLRQSTEA